MNPRLKASRAAIEMIKRFEGFRRSSAQLADGRWTIGHGHTKTARAAATVSEDDAEALLLYDLLDVQAAVNDSVFTPLNQNQFDALVAFAFNIGLDNFRRSSALRRVNEGNMVQAACAIEMWRKADLDGERIVVDALVRRRAAEKVLFLTPVGQWVAAPSPIVRPRVDYDVGISLPRTSAEISVSMSGDRGVVQRTPSAAGEPVSATVAAAEAVTERLKALNLAEADAGIDLAPAPQPALEDPEVELALPPVMETRFEPPAPPPAAPEPVAPPPAEFGLTAPPEPLPSAPGPAETAPEPMEAPPEPKLFDAPPLDTPSHIATDASRRIVRRETPIEMDDDPFGESAPKLGGVPLLILGFLGLAVFAGSVFWGVNAKGSGGLLDPMVVASVLGLVGIALVASAVYFLLVKLGGKSD